MLLKPHPVWLFYYLDTLQMAGIEGRISPLQVLIP